MAFVEYDDTEPIYEADYVSPSEVDVDLDELMPGPSHECRMLFPARGENVVKKNNRFPTKTYTFDVTKCEEIFDLLVKDGQILVPTGAKLPPLEQRQKRGFCRYHNYLGHSTSKCVLFRDLVQKALQEGRLKFSSRRMKIDPDPLRQEEALFVDPFEINMVQIAEVPSEDMVTKTPDDNMLEGIGESPDVEMAEVYPKANEDLLNFLYKCRDKGSQVSMCPRCSAVMDKQAAENFQKLQLQKTR